MVNIPYGYRAACDALVRTPRRQVGSVAHPTHTVANNLLRIGRRGNNRPKRTWIRDVNPVQMRKVDVGDAFNIEGDQSHIAIAAGEPRVVALIQSRRRL